MARFPFHLTGLVGGYESGENNLEYLEWEILVAMERWSSA